MADHNEEADGPDSNLVSVSLDGVEQMLARGSYSIIKLKELLGVAAGYLLNVVNHKGVLQGLDDGGKFALARDTTFFSQVPGGGSS